ncbi:hypothetical protein [Bradyrhizobium prioriisuperbiae]|uniref:hypothetical protein n=1 Tax=Bradyrhizobium prioriisuperbiae TaxID=2854389 RepID=UPI0028EF3602|nr:hypothetical protein [Bradyrhizobium prioritasuperba]
MKAASLDAIVAEYAMLYGEPEYQYFKKHSAWVKEPRKKGSHFTIIGKGEPISREEFEANIAEGERIRGEAFMGRYPQVTGVMSAR